MSTPATVATALRHGARGLPAKNSNLEAELLLAHSLCVPRSWLHAHPEKQLSDAQRRHYRQRLKQREAGRPLPHLLGRWEFFGLEFRVDARALIPRPETELLVEHAIAIGQRRVAGREFTIADVGVGCGIIAITLALQLPRALITASDISRPALRLTRENARRHGASARIHCVQADLLAGLDRFDLICANLPYINGAELNTLAVAQHEPRLALDGGHDGLRVIDRLLSSAWRHLRPSGSLLLEIGAAQGAAALQLARARIPQAHCCVLPDLAGRARLLRINCA
ncbi:MAG: peptide chain release factor N(5)-glutamine methyltransferase [Anaerolineales bacterium]|jgi:release factor glutamine methyltransferase|nr:peptide chain release factor N(5)-glutamine methyltransferase [Anaerolineales bacterium]HJL69357.1 peptide chain release factor N(5)-glutamine methyltransferase [Anaerolineales bacterium]HJN41768.1 peptide chain release factor N(5)-glutamine methyltransferase [Anaerolineales bacterium]|tara:strand:+ start:177 stop:1025 length:849 start_codon:yes stop_codon:yes gene_type:complete